MRRALVLNYKYIGMTPETILEVLMSIKDKDPKFTHLIVNEEFDKVLREQLFKTEDEYKVFFESIAGMAYVISPFFKEKEKAKGTCAQFNLNTIIGNFAVMGDVDDWDVFIETFLETKEVM